MSRSTQAIAMLCARLGKATFAPLDAEEYYLLAQWLRKENRRPEDLLTALVKEDGDFLQKAADSINIEIDRIKFLLNRSASVSLHWVACADKGIQIVSRADGDNYPSFLKKRSRWSYPPPLLYAMGDISLLKSGKTLAIVGARKPRDLGDVKAQDFACKVAAAAARQGLTIVSGDAEGVDTWAVDAALRAGGRCVVATGSLVKFYKSAATIKQAVDDKRLLLLSLRAADEKATTSKAMAYNELIYLLSQATLAVSVKEGGGTWNGAKGVLDKNKKILKNDPSLPSVPVFVRTDCDAPQGDRALAQSGALEWPSDWDRGDDLLLRLNGIAQSCQDQSQNRLSDPSAPTQKTTAKSPAKKSTSSNAEQLGIKFSD